MSGITNLVECIQCKAKFSISSENVTKKRYVLNGNQTWITYYDCPECGRRHYVQIDNEQTNSLLSNLTKQIGILARLKKAGKRIPMKKQRKYEATKRNLSALRAQLMKQYQEHDMLSEDGKAEKIVFTVLN